MNTTVATLLVIIVLGFMEPTPTAAENGVPRVGLLRARSTRVWVDAISGRLAELGYVDGKNIVLEWRDASGNTEALPELAAELVRLKMNVIVASGSQAIWAARKATKTIPMVITTALDPVELGFVASLARPGGNITGVAAFNWELLPKRLEILKETVPSLSRVAVVVWTESEISRAHFERLTTEATSFGVQLQAVKAASGYDLSAAFLAAAQQSPGAVMMMPSNFHRKHRSQLIKLTNQYRLPSISHSTNFVKRGGLMSYGTGASVAFRRAADYVHKILKGSTPENLPVERSLETKLTINLGTAKRIGLTIPKRVLLKADTVVK